MQDFEPAVVGHREDGTEITVPVPAPVMDKARAASIALARSNLLSAEAVAAAQSGEPAGRVLAGYSDSLSWR